MDGSDDESPSSPLQGGRGNLQQRAASQQPRTYSFDSPGGRQQMLSPQVQAVLEQEILLRRQLELQQDIQIRRRLMHETHQQIMTEIEHRKLQHLQQLQQQQHAISSPLLQQLDMQRIASQEQQLSMQDEQLYIQQQQRQLLLQQQMQQISPPFDFSASDAKPKPDAAFGRLPDSSSATPDIARQRKRARQDSISRTSDDITGQKRSKNSGKKTQPPQVEILTSGDRHRNQDRKLSVDERIKTSENGTKLKPGNKEGAKKTLLKSNSNKAVVVMSRERVGSESFVQPDRSQKKSKEQPKKKSQLDRKTVCSGGSKISKKYAVTNFQSQQYEGNEVVAADGLRSILLDTKKSGVAKNQHRKQLEVTKSHRTSSKDVAAAEKDLEAKKAGIADLLLRLPKEGRVSSRTNLGGLEGKKKAPDEQKAKTGPESFSPVPQLEEETKSTTTHTKYNGERIGDPKQLSKHERELFDHLMNHNPGREQIESFQHDDDKKEQESQCSDNDDDDSGTDSKRQIAALIANLSKHRYDEEANGMPVESIQLPLENENKEKKDDVLAVKDFTSFIPKLPVEPEYTGNEDEDDIGLKKSYPFEKTQVCGVSEGKDSQANFQSNINLTNGSIQTSTQRFYEFQQRDVKGPVVFQRLNDAPTQPVLYCTPVDTWWPSNNTIRRERRLRGYRSDEEDSAEDMNSEHGKTNQKSQMSSLRDRIENFVEPGVLEKLPHCKLYLDHARQEKGGVPIEPLFCCQVTESFCTDPMVCCSICSTWRHAACGGHYKRYKVDSKEDSENPFTPICDLCHEEDQILRKHFKARCRIGRQRTEHLRRTLSTSSVIRQAAYAKHSGQYKWPLGAVSATHISGHTRSVHVRHERAQKQWSEMAMKLGNGLGYRPKERLKVRTRELERLLTSVEDAEGVTDRHNIMVFLQRDTSKKHPAGFEMPRRNFFDPEEDDYIEEEEEEESNARDGDGFEKEESNGSDDGSSSNESDESGDDEFSDEDSASLSDCQSDQSDVLPVSRTDSKEDIRLKEDNVKFKRGGDDGASNEEERDYMSVVSEECPSGSNERKDMEHGNSSASSKKGHKNSYDEHINEKDEVLSATEERGHEAPTPPRCANEGCRRKPRFDSVFCSDSCGVAALEFDLLHSFEYASDVHPSLLRP